MLDEKTKKVKVYSVQTSQKPNQFELITVGVELVKNTLKLLCFVDREWTFKREMTVRTVSRVLFRVITNQDNPSENNQVYHKDTINYCREIAEKAMIKYLPGDQQE